MSGGLGNISIGSIKPKQPRKRATIVKKETPVVKTVSLVELSEVQPLLKIPGIEPYIRKDLIPDLLYMYAKDPDYFQTLISKSDPKDPTSILFNNKYQNINEATKQMEKEILLDEFEVAEHAYLVCQCGSKFIRVQSKQKRAGDEGISVDAYCTKCKRSWAAQ